jgi:tetratricopeptide (TPR) repeat protein
MTQETKTHKAMISSTARDLPVHRQEVLEACLRQGVTVVRMEDLPAHDARAAGASLKMVDEADIYIGVFAHSYGYIPDEDNPERISVTEMEYNRAVEMKKPRLIFVMDPTHPITIDQVEQGEGAAKLKVFLGRIGKENIVRFFKSPTDLRAEVINSLAQHLKEVVKQQAQDSSESAKSTAAVFHYVSPIPTPPEPYVAHPYTLLQTHGLVGRQPELNLLTDWVTKPNSDVYRAHVLSVVAIGGMGKSALTWKWFNEIAPAEMKPLAGRMWWSFYESDASVENFIIRALAYVSHRSIEEVLQLAPPDRENQLFNILDREPYLLVLDGLERILVAYARMDAAYLSDTDYDQATANYVAAAYGLPESAARSFTGEHRLRKTADPRAGAVLRRLSQIRSSRILISTRLYPFDLQRLDTLPLPGCFALFLPGLSNDDALNLWRSFNVSGAQAELVPVFNSVGNHALLVQALASEIANYRPARGDFERWRADNPNFNPAGFPRVQEAMGHVLEYALRGLGNVERKVLDIIAGFRMPTAYHTLAAVLVGEDKPCRDARELDTALTELEDRGLVGWDRRSNRYDLHPIVRGVVWDGLGDEARQRVYTRLNGYFESAPTIENYLDVSCLEDLTPTIELYHTLIGLRRYDDACDLFYERLSKAMLWRLSAGRERVDLLERLFPDGLDQPPRLSHQNDRSITLESLALGYQLSGRPGWAVEVLRRANAVCSDRGDNLSIGLCNLANSLRITGGLREAEVAARRALVITRQRENRFQEGISLFWLGMAMVTRGEPGGSVSSVHRSLRMFIKRSHHQMEGVVNGLLAQRAIGLGEFAAAREFADRAGELATVQKYEADFIRAARANGEAELGLSQHEVADERLHHALSRARAVNLVEEELPALTALAELRRRQGDAVAARELLDDVWEYAERGPYPLFHADALNVLAQIERDAGNTAAAVEAATKAYRLAWCDGPPYAYHWGLIKAQKHLEELGAPLPEMPPFDESKFEPMPEVEIDPDDEFHAGPPSTQ